MRILFIIHELALNGAVVALFDQACRLRAQGQHVQVLVPSLAGPAAALRGKFEEAGIPLLASAEIADADIVVGCTIFAADALFQVLGRKPVIWWIHEGRAGVRHVLSNPKAAQVLARAQVLVFPSRAVAETLFAPVLSGIGVGRVEIVPGIVEPASDGPTASKRPGVMRVLCVGSVYPRKRQSDLVQAVSMLRGAKVECVMAGEVFGLDAPAQELVQARPDQFILAGGLPPERIRELYRSADVFCLPSEDESMPLAPVEAASYGVPVILSDLECHRGVWRHGHNALLYPVGDLELLAWSLRMALESPSLRARLVRGGLAVLPWFSRQRAGALFDAALERAASSSP